MISRRVLTTSVRASFAARSITTSARTQSSHGSHVSHDPEVLEREKHRSLHEKHDDSSQPHKKHAPGWIEDLASVSEANVKADRGPIDSPEELQKMTIEYLKKRHGHPDDLPHRAADTVSEVVHKAADKICELLPGGQDASGTAPYDKDAVEGPLADKGKK